MDRGHAVKTNTHGQRENQSELDEVYELDAVIAFSLRPLCFFECLALNYIINSTVLVLCFSAVNVIKVSKEKQ